MLKGLEQQLDVLGNASNSGSEDNPTMHNYTRGFVRVLVEIVSVKVKNCAENA
jgi:hypothetical protein